MSRIRPIRDEHRDTSGPRFRTWARRMKQKQRGEIWSVAEALHNEKIKYEQSTSDLGKRAAPMADVRWTFFHEHMKAVWAQDKSVESILIHSLSQVR